MKEGSERKDINAHGKQAVSYARARCDSLVMRTPRTERVH